ncbi:DUF2101 domain-containing protein [Thermococcus sp. M36]|uniref:DUF2101 family protein n=1 Tax=Thermococcus sp. M36 TaxID=1638261 RepID=UPI00143A6C82|nr:DUF2101 family protein [Thermococcus sp. M36]NJE05774.1 DUF2101 domain-containing protein [Thermococcus sp. M36]
MGLDLEELLYRIGEGAETLPGRAARALGDIIVPEASPKPPSFKLLRKLVRKDVTVHELLSLRLQLSFIAYLLANLLLMILHPSPAAVLALSMIEALYVRRTTLKYRDFFVDHEPYAFFYTYLTAITFLAFEGYVAVKRYYPHAGYQYMYLIAVFLLVLAFRWAFKEKYGRDYTYGTVEEVKNDLARVFVHDDIAANVKPGRYWVPAVRDLAPGRVVKLLVEDRKLRGAIPVRILEVYLGEPQGQSSHTSTEPKAEIE